MRFMIIRRADEETEAGVLPSGELLNAMGKYNAEMAKAGILRGGEGLAPSAQGAKVSFADGVPTVIDGPFAETKELVGGFSIIEVDSREEAIAWLRRWPAVDGHGGAQLELRRILEPEDFGEQFTEEMQAREAKLREGIDDAAG